ncbi:hypothetical protein ACWD6R_22565 [Streptomyces sp. NPDC005151]
MRRTGALAGVNAGFFVLPSGSSTTPGPWFAGTEGDPAGISIVRGDLVSEAVTGRPAFVLPTDSGKGTAIRPLATRLTARAGNGSVREVTGLNRQSGLIVNCGGTGDAPPSPTRPTITPAATPTNSSPSPRRSAQRPRQATATRRRWTTPAA